MHILALTDGGAGMRAQACGLAKQLAATLFDNNAVPAVSHQVVHTPAVVKLLPPQWARRAWHVFAPPETLSATPPANVAPDIVIGCGTAAQSAVLAYKKENGAFAVCIQRPRGSDSFFDAVIAPQHDYAKDDEALRHPNVFATLGAVGLVTPALLAARRAAAQSRFAHIPTPRTALLMGGNNRAFVLTAAAAQTLAASVLDAAKDGGILSSASRRTNEATVQTLRQTLDRPNCFFYDGRDKDNPYLDMLAAADRFVITGDSVNMLSEACAAARPIYIAALSEKNARAAQKFNHFHAALLTNGCVRRWDGVFAEWASPGLDETARAANFVQQQYHTTH